MDPLAITSKSADEDFLADLVKRIRSVIGEGEHSLHAPKTDIGSSPTVLEALRSSTVSVDPKINARAQLELRRVTGEVDSVLTSSGTSALHLTLLSLGVSSGDVVICPSVSFVATANAIRYCGAIPLFLDVEEDDLSLSPELLRRTLEECSNKQGLGFHSGKFPKAVIAVSVFGIPPKINELEELTHSYGIPLVIDAAGALGTEIGGKSLMSRGAAAITSFNGNKIITAGAGGAIFSSDTEFLDKCAHLSQVAKIPHPFEYVHDALGFNYRLPALNAALLVDQLKIFDRVLELKRALMERYRQALEGLPLEMMEDPEDSNPNNWLCSFKVNRGQPSSQKICRFLNAQGIGARAIWSPLPALAHLQQYGAVGSQSKGEDLHKRTVSLPSSYHIML